MEPLSASLFLRNNRHQKQYNLELVQAVDGWLVNFAFGAVGKSLKVGTKTSRSMPYCDARRIYEKLFTEKTAKVCDCCGGRYESVALVPAESSPVARRAIEPIASPQTSQVAPMQRRFVPELLEAADGMAKQYTENVAFCAQRKYDGVRLAVDFSRASPYEGYNRKGERVDVPESSVANLLRSHIDSAFIDGEWIAAVGQYVAFDLLEINGEDLRRLPYSERYATLQELGEYLNVATLFRTTDQKTAALLDEIEMSGEGLVYKKLSAPYMLGRQGVNVKLKLWASATVRVCAKKKEDGKASFATEVLRDSKWWPCGTVTLTKTADLPKPGTYREIKYLYVGNGGRLYQPEDLGPRSDVDDSDCGWGQLKIKQEVERLAA